MENKEKQNGYSHIMKYTGLFGGIQMLNMLVGVVRNKLVAMILGPGGMGLLSLFNSTIKLVSESTNMGISMSGVKTISQNFDDKANDKLCESVKMIRLWSLLTALLGFVVCALFGSSINSLTFTWGDHSFHYMMLSPAIAFMAIIGGETAVLKGTRQLTNLMLISFYYVLITAAISVPIYYYIGEKGIVPSLVLAAFVNMVLALYCSTKKYPYRLSFNKELLVKGSSMIRLGIAFVFAGILGSGADFLIRTILNTYGYLDEVGLYNAGYMMIFVYAGMVFSAMESDYFPRLSAIRDDVEAQNKCVNQQIEVTLLLISPLLIAFLIGMPILLPLLYSGHFMPVLGMIQVAVMAMFIRALALPVEYIPLAKGNSILYLFIEALYDIMIVVLTFVLYNWIGLLGAGVALTLSMIADYVVAYIVIKAKYGYSISTEVLKYVAMQFPLGILAFLVTMVESRLLYWSMGLLLIMVSLAISLTILHKKTTLWEKLKKKILRR